MKQLPLLLAFCWYQNTAVQAQSVYKPDSVKVMTVLQQDTIRAIHHLFQDRREGASTTTKVGFALLAAGVALVQVFSALASIPAGGRTDGSRIASATIKISIPGLVIAGTGIAKGVRFSRQREMDLVSTYQYGQAIPQSIRHRLTLKYF